MLRWQVLTQVIRTVSSNWQVGDVRHRGKAERKSDSNAIPNSGQAVYCEYDYGQLKI